MTYEKIFDLKFRDEIPTCELGKLFPREKKKISRIALLDLPLSTLKKVIKRREEFQTVVSLRQTFLKKSSDTRKKD